MNQKDRVALEIDRNIWQRGDGVCLKEENK